MTTYTAQLSGLIQKAIENYAGSLEAASFADYIAQRVIDWQQATAGMALSSAPAGTKDDIARMLADLRAGSIADSLTTTDLTQVIADLKATAEALQTLVH